jgi:IS5 family transposase
MHVDKGYRGHDYPDRFRVWISGQVRRVTASIRREIRRRAAIEPVIGHLKAEHRMNRNYLKGFEGDRANAVLAAAGYNFRLLLRWLALLFRRLIQLALLTPFLAQSKPLRRPKRLNRTHGGFFTNDGGVLAEGGSVGAAGAVVAHSALHSLMFFIR